LSPDIALVRSTPAFLQILFEGFKLPCPFSAYLFLGVDPELLLRRGYIRNPCFDRRENAWMAFSFAAGSPWYMAMTRSKSRFWMAMSSDLYGSVRSGGS
jgi:hypothetical protein